MWTVFWSPFPFVGPVCAHGLWLTPNNEFVFNNCTFKTIWQKIRLINNLELNFITKKRKLQCKIFLLKYNRKSRGFHGKMYSEIEIIFHKRRGIQKNMQFEKKCTARFLTLYLLNWTPFDFYRRPPRPNIVPQVYKKLNTHYSNHLIVVAVVAENHHLFCPSHQCYRKCLFLSKLFHLHINSSSTGFWTKTGLRESGNQSGI